MKKQIKKLSLNKKTISNLKHSEMSNKFGGSTFVHSCEGTCRHCGGNFTRDGGKTCPGHNNCYTC